MISSAYGNSKKKKCCILLEGHKSLVKAAYLQIKGIIETDKVV